ncbi:zinc-ribbon domain-containing protein [Streptomyces sp. NPDC002187]|uniref:zinc ribbon domain-containing protein n=1 Tax=Streptomyces sp. NPDC002187 TaxID=3364637 RepID=UPI0036C57DA8
MASYCPHCGNPSPDEARFCMKCGRERLPEPAAPPQVPPSAPAVPSAPPPSYAAPPAYAPGPVQPSPVGEFIGRVLRGDWLSAARATIWPTGLLLVLAAVLALPTYGQDDDVVVGWSDRMRIALAMLLQGVGGGIELAAAASSPYGPGGYPGGGYSGSDYSGSGTESIGQGVVSFSLVPMTVTVLFVAALFVGARMLRGRGEGLEAAVRMSLLVTGEVLVLGLFAQPEVQGVAISSAPLLAALGALGISLAVSAGVLQRDRLAAWTAQRPGARSAVRALGTAVRALGVVLALCSLTGFVLYANADDVDGQALLIALPILPNIGFAVLGLSWGAPVDYAIDGQHFSVLGSGSGHGSFGLGEISDVWGGGAVAGTLALGTVCALVIGVLAARRSADRREQVLAGAFALGLILLGAGLGGLSVELGGGVRDFGSPGSSELAPSVPDVLLFGLLWVGGATLLGPYALRLTGGHPAPPVHGPGQAWPPGVPTPPFASPAGPAAPGLPTPAGGAEAQAPAVAPDSVPMAPAGPGAAATPAVPEAQAGSPALPGAGVPAPAGTPTGPAAPGMPAAPAGPATASDPGFLPGAAEPGPTAQPYGAHPQVEGRPPNMPYAAPDPYAVAAAQTATAHVAPAPAPAPDAEAGNGRRRKVLVWTATLVAAFVVGGGATAGLLLFQDKKDDTTVSQPSQEADNKARATRSPSPSPSGSASASVSPSASASASPSATQADDGPLPAGMVLKQDPAGFTVAVMDGWTRRQAGSQVFYEAPTGGDYLQIGVIKDTPMTSYDNFVGLEKKHLETPETRYERKQLTENTYQDRPGALWEFVHVPEPEEGALQRHVIDQAFVAPDGTEYAILAAGRADRWDADKDVVFSTALRTFRIG